MASPDRTATEFPQPVCGERMFDILSDVQARSENLDMTARFEGLETLLTEIKQCIDRLSDDCAENRDF
ncbi:hypothetical protein [Candidatus Halocynthiibacter alkanivorans]|uniref:hypothetical protein n=1 Tax=Candidatus Halocynthiibacter alkanivorans TaxID=2267619 RepID=UPI00109CC432|nr:hypothetical protein [Candidatus Halocynthiibacter alkanivorans]